MLYRESIKPNASPETKERYCNHNKTLRKNKCEEIRKNGSKLWKLINKITNKSKNKQSIISKINVDGIVHEHPKEIANKLAHYFANVGDRLSRALPESKKKILLLI